MKAIVYYKTGSPEVLQQEEVPAPEAGPGEVLVRVHYASVNPKDCMVRKGRMGPLFWGSFPRQLGSDFSGEVAVVGKAVQGFKTGDRVYGMLPTLQLGAYAEWVKIKAIHLGKIPQKLSGEAAGGLPLVGLTSLQALRDVGKLQAGQELCINGASGGVGTVAIQLAKAMGGRVTAICSQRNEALVRDLGADQVVDYTQQDLRTLPFRFDLFFDVYGNQSLEKVRGLLKPKGRYVTTIPRPANFLQQALTLFSAQKSKVVVVHASGKDMDILSEMVRKGKLRPVIDRVFPLDQAAEAHAYIETKRAQGKVLLSLEFRV